MANTQSSVSVKERWDVFKRKVKGFMKGLIGVRSESWPVLRRIMVPIITVLCVGWVIFLYLSLVKIDEGTPAMYATLDNVFYVFCGLLVLAVAGTVFLITVSVLRRKEYRRHFNKNKLKRRITVFDVVITVLLGLFALLCAYPIVYVIAGSFNQGADYNAGGVYILPRVFTFQNYKIVLQNDKLWHSYLVTIGRTALGTVSALIFTSIVAYAMSRPKLKFKPFFYWVNIFTMFFGGGLVPYFLIIKAIGLYDTFWVYIIPGLYSVYNMIVLQSGFRQISEEIHDAATIDGAGEFRIYWQIYMPLSKPVLATIALWLLVGHWNGYFDTMIYTNSESLHTLQYFLLQAIQTSSMTEGLPSAMVEKMSAQTMALAAIIISIIPVLFLFPLVRKNFASGIMIGSLKG